ncbi:MAG TPA: periplasmic heavy metal sensor [Thermoanaerobaculia bacterium]
MKTATAALLVFLAALAAAGQALGDGKWWKRPRIAQELQLSTEQDAQLEKIFARSKPRLIDLRAELEKKQFDYEQAMQSDATDRKTLEAKIDAREEARANLQKELAVMELDMKQVLKPEQRERLMRLREEGRRRAMERRQRYRDGDPDAGSGRGGRQRRQGAPAETTPN